MKSYGEPMIAHFATHDADSAGYSFCQMIETSNITGHFSDKTGDCYIDVFSCKEYDTDVAADVIDDFFRPEEVMMRYFERASFQCARVSEPRAFNSPPLSTPALSPSIHSV